MNVKSLHGPKLVGSGYKLVPIKAGEKQPMTKGWPQMRADLPEVMRWAESRYYGGLGVLGEFTPGIDIDVREPEIVEKLITWIYENIGQAPVRTGDAPRVLIPCSPPEGKSLGPDASIKYQDPRGRTHQIEIKATGQQWVCYGTHPKTKKEYTWSGPDGNKTELHDWNVFELPTLDGEKINALFNSFYSIAPKDWEAVTKGSRSRQRQGGLTSDGFLIGAASFENYKPPLHIDKDRIEALLRELSPDAGHDVWLKVGMALYHQFEGSDEGKELFRNWSEKSIEFDEKEIENRWPTWAEKSYGGEPVTMASVIKMVNDARREADDPTLRLKSRKLADWEKRFVMVEQRDETEVHDIGVPIYRSPRRLLRAFREHNSGYLHRFLTPEGEYKTVPMVEAWKDSLNTRHFAGYTYQPGQPRFCKRQNAYGDDSLYINTFYFPPHPEDAEADLEPFNDFMRHLFPVKSEREWMFSWLARLIQYPGTRSFVTPINITHVTGTGRGLLFEILRLLIGGHNTHDVSKDDMEGRFNGFLDKCLIAVVQEIKANTGKRKYQSWERMKSLLADTTANIQSKGENSYTATVYANFLMFSNNIDALPIQDIHERRIYAMQGANRPISTEEIDRIVFWKDNPKNISALFNTLKILPVNLGDFKRAPVSETKIQMVRATIGVAGADLSQWLKEEAPAVFDYDLAMQALEQTSDDVAALGVSRESFSRQLSDKGFHSAQIRIKDRRHHVYYRPEDVEFPLSHSNLRELFGKQRIPRDFLDK